MSPASLRSPRHQTKLSTHPSSGRLKAAESQAMHFHPQKSNSTLTVQHRAYTNQLPSQLQLQPSTRFQLKPGTQLHSDRQLRSQQSQMLPQSGSYCHLQSLSESDSALHSSPHNSSQSQRPQKCPESQRQLHGIFSQQPLTPGCRATAPRHSFAFSFQGSSGSYSPDEGSSLFGSPEESSTGASSSPCRSLTAHLVAQQQKGLLQRTTGRLHLPFPPQSATPQQMPLPSPGAKQHAPGLMGCPFEKHFGVHRISDASTNWMEHMTPDLPPFEATVPHATDYIATDFRSAVIDDLQGLSAVDLSV